MLWLCLFLLAVETRAIEKGSNGYKVTEVKAVPAAITVQGYLEENGSPVNGTVQMKFKLYTTSSGGTPIWTSSTYSVNVSNGYFSKVLSISKKYFPGSDRYLEIVVNGQTLSPRLRITGVPYSFKADTCDYSKNADKLDGHNWGDKYPNADKLDDYDSGDFIRWKQSGGASVGQVLKWNGTQWSPADDEVGGASDTANYSLNSDKVDGYHASAFIRWDQSGGASTGQVLKWNGSQWAPSNDNAGDNDWTISGSNVYKTSGFVGIGTSSMSAALDIVCSSDDALEVHSSGAYEGIEIDAGDNGIEISAGGNGIEISSAGTDGIYIPSGAVSDDAIDIDGGSRGIEISGCTDGIWITGCTNPIYISGSYNGVLANVTGSYPAVYGTGKYYGVEGKALNSYSSSSYAIYGYNNPGGNYDAKGVYGKCWPADFYGYGGYFEGGYIGVYGKSYYAGVYGYSSGGYYAGYFNGDVHITGTLSKGAGSFVIDHPLDPENKLLRHNFVESPEYLCLYRGKVRLDANGEATVKMPDYFAALTKEDEATVNLTPIGKPFLVGYEWNSDYTAFKVYGEPNREVSYIVLADRDDPVIKKLRKPVVQDKSESKLCKPGQLLYPEAYGYPKEMGVDYQRRYKRMKKHEHEEDKMRQNELDEMMRKFKLKQEREKLEKKLKHERKRKKNEE